MVKWYNVNGTGLRSGFVTVTLRNSLTTSEPLFSHLRDTPELEISMYHLALKYYGLRVTKTLMTKQVPKGYATYLSTVGNTE